MSQPRPSLPDPEQTMELSVAEVSRWHRLPADQRPCLLDCRQPEEVDICRIEGSVCVPMVDIPAALERLRDLSQRGLVVYCHHGMRSLHATAFLRGHGLDQAFSMAGGVEQWAHEIDPQMPRY